MSKIDDFETYNCEGQINQSNILRQNSKSSTNDVNPLMIAELLTAHVRR